MRVANFTAFLRRKLLNLLVYQLQAHRCNANYVRSLLMTRQCPSLFPRVRQRSIGG